MVLNNQSTFRLLPINFRLESLPPGHTSSCLQIAIAVNELIPRYAVVGICKCYLDPLEKLLQKLNFSVFASN